MSGSVHRYRPRVTIEAIRLDDVAQLAARRATDRLPDWVRAVIELGDLKFPNGAITFRKKEFAGDDHLIHGATGRTWVCSAVDFPKLYELVG